MSAAVILPADDLSDLFGEQIPASLAPLQTSRDLAIAGEAYEGAKRIDQALATWDPGLLSADAEILPEKGLLDARVRDTLRNDSYVAAGVNLHKDSIVGSVYLLNSKPALAAISESVFDETWKEEFEEEVETKFGLWAESPDNWPDAARINSFTEGVRLAVGVFVFAGEYLETVEWLRDAGRVYNTAFQAVELDRLSNPPTVFDSKKIRGGVEFNDFGAPIAYHIRKGHPADFFDVDAYSWRRVPVRKPWGRLQVLHVIEQRRPDQTRGISEMVSALKELRITKRFREIVLQNAVVNATYAATIESELPSEVVFSALGGGQSASFDESLQRYYGAWLSQVSKFAAGARNLRLDGVMIPHLLPGTKLNMQKAGEGGPLGTEFESSVLRYIAAALNISYEELSRDFTKTNYSSSRASSGLTWRSMQSRKRICADRVATVRYRLWLEEAVNKGHISAFPERMRRNGWIYQGQNFDALSRCEWIGAGRGQIDELKETQAAVLRLKFGLSTREREIARINGADWRRDIEQQAREKRFAARHGLNFDAVEDNSLNAASGSPRDEDGDEKEAV